MTTYAILNRDPGQDVGALVAKVYADAYVWSSQVAFVRDSASPIEVSRKLDVVHKVDGGKEGTHEQIVVIEAAPSYWGYTDTALWNWLKTSFEAES